MVRINLLPVKVSKKHEAGKQQLVLFLVLLVAGLVGNYFWAESRADDLKTREAKLTRTREEIARLDRIIGEVKNVKAEQQALKEKLDILDKLKAGRTGPVRMLDELATITPKRLWIRSMKETNGAIAFQGTAATIDDVSAFMEALKTARSFADVELKKTTARVASGLKLVDFDLSTSVRYTAPDPKNAPDPKKAAAPGGK
jgi:type IV pilus assembly protein PilN